MQEQTQLLNIPLGDLKISAMNPRKYYDQASMDQLTASVRQKGVLQPILVRPSNGKYEVVAGTRRFKAATIAGLKSIPAVVREIDDQEALEMMVIENLQREDVHPLEEAQGYFILSRKPGYDAAKIAEKIGRSVKYVYDRMKLLSLTKEAKELFLKGKFEAGHAILLARLTPSQQEEAIDQNADALFQHEYVSDDLLLTEEEKKDEFGERVKAKSVREFQQWIDEHVRFQRDEVDPMLFPETAMALKTAQEEKEKVVAITEEHFVHPSARAKERTISPQSWQRADGKEGSKKCEHSVLGVITVGPGRGQSMEVCIAKEKCKTHWGDWQKEREKRAKAREAGGSEKEAKKEQQAKKQAEEAERKNKERESRFNKAKPAVSKAVRAAIASMPAGADSILANILIDRLKGWDGLPAQSYRLPIGKTAEDLVRYAASIILGEQMSRYRAHETFPKLAKRILGLDVWKLINEAVPAEQPKKQETVSPGKRKKRKTQKDKVQEAFEHRQKAAKEKKKQRHIPRDKSNV